MMMDITLAPDAPRKGWLCQSCGRSYAPIVQVCQPCNDKITAREKNSLGGKRTVEIRRRLS